MAILDNTVENILDVLLDHPNVGYSKKELAEKAGVSRSALYNCWDVLEKNKIVIEKNKYGGTTLYRLNSDSDLVNYLGKVIDEKAESENEDLVKA